MTLEIGLHHETHYRYDRNIEVGPQTIRLRPAPHCRTPIKSYSLRVEPADHFINWQQDPQGNFLARVVFPEKTREFKVIVDLVAEMPVINPFDFFVEESVEKWPFAYEPRLREELEPYLEADPAGPELTQWLKDFPQDQEKTIDLLVALNARLAGDIEYLIRMEPGVQTPEETLGLGRGSCRDTSWLLVQILRNLGVAARFASGYLIQLVADVKSLDGPSGAEEDFTDLHAWVEAYVPGAGWLGLDATSGLLTGEGHIPLACTSKPHTAAPIDGLVEPSEVEFSHVMSVERLAESPRVTKPYTEKTWKAVDRLAKRIDKKLAEGDVRLTMGGEPTFVSIDDMESAEWNTEADGPTKRVLAAELTSRLRDRLAPGGLVHLGQGKWYPGEPLPRWGSSLFWRQDEQALWSDPALLAKNSATGTADIALAERFVHGLAGRLALDEGAIHPAFEDPIEVLREKAKHGPTEVEAPTGDHGVDDLGDPVAYVLPAMAVKSPGKSANGERVWRTERWTYRRNALLLAAGDSPAGYRLPLGDLPELSPDDYPYIVPTDPLVSRSPFKSVDACRQPFLKGTKAKKSKARKSGRAEKAGAKDKTTYVRTALVVEPRGGKICVFLPPFETADDFVDLIAAIEDTAAELDTAVVIDGYEPPTDPRLNKLSVTPDPGVIEVNIHPSKDWDGLKQNTEALYEEARLSRLGTEKFLVDGRHTGTGGGNHLVLGGGTPADSPFLRRPHLLRSLIAYWINHPSLSYLFSGLFIGPTSQAPRLDEARQDSLYELEIAFAQIPDDHTKECPPWLVDRIFRHLLVDVTGNTHRAEICIDKLYSPDSATGRLGLVEFRAFEMPPHARMSLAQQLIMRALVARFWDAPYKTPIVRWGTALHDRFMLPHFVWSDFKGVLADLKEAGFAFDPEWFGPHFEFRFPRYGSFRYDDVEVEVRHALEPWHVLGEEGAVGTTSRYVDSSVERLQVHATGLTPGRYELACNGRQMPLHSLAAGSGTGRTDEAVSGVRFRAWQPSRCLHPTVPIHAPLTFDLFDRWSERVVAGCRYHVTHPGGRSFETFPVNGNEAEGRRLARFSANGHTPGRHALSPAEPNRDFPMTLDLRRYPAIETEDADE